MPDDVSRETSAPEPPPEAVEVFGPALSQARSYADLLAGPGVVRGLIGPREVPRLWERHLLNSAALAGLIAADASVADLGSGAGLPGIPLALARPDLSVRLVEPLLRRTRFLDEVLPALGLRDRVVVDRHRAEELHGVVTVDVVTARALAPLERLVGWALPLLAEGGRLLALKGSSAQEEVEAARAALDAAGAASVRVLRIDRLGRPTAAEPEDGSTVATVVEVVAGRAGTPARARRAGMGRSGRGDARPGPTTHGTDGRTS